MSKKRKNSPRRKRSAKKLRDIHRSNLQFLLDLKGATGILHNLIHDNLALMAVAQFKTRHPELTCVYTNAGHSGIDIKGWTKDRKIGLVAEVKTTLPNAEGDLMGPQLKQIKKDLDRLKKWNSDLRYLVLLAASTESAVRSQLKIASNYKGIEIINAFHQKLTQPEEVD
jgi:hypothetical protein